MRSIPRTHYMANRFIKSTLTQSALIAIRFSPHLKQYFTRLISKGKKMQAALNNVKNKLLHMVTAIVKNDMLYSPDYSNAC